MKVEIRGDRERATKLVEAARRIDRPAELDQLDAATGLLRLRAKACELQEVSGRE